jgi:hypothetical protein
MLYTLTSALKKLGSGDFQPGSFEAGGGGRLGKWDDVREWVRFAVAGVGLAKETRRWKMEFNLERRSSIAYDS